MLRLPLPLPLKKDEEIQKNYHFWKLSRKELKAMISLRPVDAASREEAIPWGNAC